MISAWKAHSNDSISAFTLILAITPSVSVTMKIMEKNLIGHMCLRS